SMGMSLMASNCVMSPNSAASAAAYVPSRARQNNFAVARQANRRGVGHRSGCPTMERVPATITKNRLRANICRGSAAENRWAVRTVRNLECGDFDAFQHDGPDQLGKLPRMQIAIRKAGADLDSAKSRARERAQIILQSLTARNA